MTTTTERRAALRRHACPACGGAVTDGPTCTTEGCYGPHVCPGCFAIEEPCAPGCIEAAIEARMCGDLDDDDGRWDEEGDRDE